MNGNRLLTKLASTIHYNLIDIKGYAIVSIRRIPMLEGGK